MSNIRESFDLIVVGTGPGGEGAAMQAAKAGKRVAVVEKYPEVGGGCTHWGTIPSKALRQSVQKITEARSTSLLGPDAQNLPSFGRLLKHAGSVIAKQVAMRQSFYDRNAIHMVRGFGRFIDEHTMEVEAPDGIPTRYEAEYFVVAPGSSPHHPEGIDFSHPRIRDSDTILKLPETPRSITIFGAGVIGCEYASIFRSLDAKLNLINTRDRLLSFLDDEIVDALAYHLRDQGCVIRHNEEFDHVEPSDTGVTLHLKSGKKITTDILLWANGRTGNTAGMGFEALAIETDKRGLIRVDEHYRTARKNIYAVGDVVGWPSLASASYDQGRYAASHIIDGSGNAKLLGLVPVGIYTIPQISAIGKTERELTEAKVPYEVGQSLFRSLARAQIANYTVGSLKILFHRDTLEILGIHCFGYQAAEIIHIGQAIMSQPSPNNTIRYFIDTTFNYPTMAEAYRVAALNGYNRVS